MSEFEADGERFSYNIIAAADAESEFVLEIEYSGGEEDEPATTTVSLGVSERGDATKEVVVGRLKEWSGNNPGLEVESFEVTERQVCRSGKHLGSVEQKEEVEIEVEELEPGVVPADVSTGDRVAYYVQGPGSTVYGYLTEGVVEAVSPNREHPKVESPGLVELDVGEQTKEVPLAWVVGDATKPAVQDAIDRPRPSL